MGKKLCSNNRCEWSEPDSVGAQCGWEGDQCPECGCTYNPNGAPIESPLDMSDLECFE